MHLPPYNIFPTLHAQQITLREILPSDLDDILEISVYDGKRAADTAEALVILQRIERDYHNGDSVHWGIADKNSNVIMGTCGYYRGLRDGTGELGCVLRPAFRGQGVMTEAMQAAIDFGRQQMGLEHIIAITTGENLKAISLLERLQFVRVTDENISATIQRISLQQGDDTWLYLLKKHPETAFRDTQA